MKSIVIVSDNRLVYEGGGYFGCGVWLLVSMIISIFVASAEVIAGQPYDGPLSDSNSHVKGGMSLVAILRLMGTNGVDAILLMRRDSRRFATGGKPLTTNADLMVFSALASTAGLAGQWHAAAGVEKAGSVPGGPGRGPGHQWPLQAHWRDCSARRAWQQVGVTGQPAAGPDRGDSGEARLARVASPVSPGQR